MQEHGAGISSLSISYAVEECSDTLGLSEQNDGLIDEVNAQIIGNSCARLGLGNITLYGEIVGAKAVKMGLEFYHMSQGICIEQLADGQKVGIDSSICNLLSGMKE